MKRKIVLAICIFFLFAAMKLEAQTYSEGEHVQISWNGKYYPGVILKKSGDNYSVSYDGYGSEYNETVTKDRLKKMEPLTKESSAEAMKQNFTEGEHVMIAWQGNYYPGEIISISDNKYYVSYDGYGPESNEYVTKDRLKRISGATAQNNTGTSTGIAFYKGVETIWDLSMASDGKFLFCASAYGTIKILNAADLTLFAEVNAGKDPVMSVSVSGDGKYLAVGAYQKLSIYKKNEAGKYEFFFSPEGYSTISKVKFASTGTWLAIGASPSGDYTRTQVDIMNVEDRSVKNLIRSTNAEYAVSGFAWSADNANLAVAISNKKHGIDVFDVASAKLDYHITHTSDVVSCSFSPDGKSIAGGGTDMKVNLWNTSTHQKLWSSSWSDEGTNYVYGVAFSPDGKTIAVCGNGSGTAIKLYNSIDGSMKKELAEQNPGGNCVIFSPDGKSVFVALTTYGNAAKVDIVEKYGLE